MTTCYFETGPVSAVLKNRCTRSLGTFPAMSHVCYTLLRNRGVAFDYPMDPLKRFLHQGAMVLPWLFFNLVLPLLPLGVALYLSANIITVGGIRPAGVITLLTSGDILFLSIVLCSVGLHDLINIREYSQIAWWHTLLWWSLFLLIILASSLYSIVLFGRLYNLTLDIALAGPVGLTLVIALLSCCVHTLLLRAKRNPGMEDAPWSM